MLIFALGSVVVGIYLMTVVGIDIHQNGLKSVVETIWNGVK
ncbi:periplasmic protein [Enterobacteria phage RB68]|nr:periplasmic protein [Enterobacteria phage RB68]AIT75728.1 putative periplasmic protein [Enterobacteria phage RB68]